MSATSYPIPPDVFLLAISTLELPQLHAESSRLKNSIHHLQRSNISLSEFIEDEACKTAIEENEEVIRQQTERIGMIDVEVEKRGFGGSGHAAGDDASGSGWGEVAQRLSRTEGATTAATTTNGSATTPAVTTTNGDAHITATNGTTSGTINGAADEDEEEGVYL